MSSDGCRLAFTTTDFHLGYVVDLPTDGQFDGATLFGVLHHQPGDRAKRQLLDVIASRLAPDPPASEDAVSKLLADAGFAQPCWFFSSLFWGTCLTRRIDARAPRIEN